MDRGFAKSKAVTVLSRKERIPRSIGHFGRIRGTCPLTKRVPTFEVGILGSANRLRTDDLLVNNRPPTFVVT